MDYSEIYQSFLSRVKDPSLLALPKKYRNEFCNDFLKRGAANPVVRRLFASFKMDDDFEQLTYQLKRRIRNTSSSIGEGDSLDLYDSSSEDSFIREVLVQAMAIEWMRPQIDNSVALTPYVLGSKEEKTIKNTLNINLAQLKRNEVILQKYTRNYGYYNVQT